MNMRVEKKGKRGLRLLETSFELVSHSFLFDHSNDGVNFNCIASIQGMSTMMDSVKIDLFCQSGWCGCSIVVCCVRGVVVAHWWCVVAGGLND